jgi:ADP-ribosylglycohydrolase
MIEGASDDLVDRAVGALLGLAVGDAVGTTLEYGAPSLVIRFPRAAM